MSVHLFSELTSPQTADRLLDQALTVLKEHIRDRNYLHRISVALSEAITNACVHGNKMDQKKSVSLALQINESQIIADITDQGKGALKRIEDRPRSELMSESGRGIDLICQLSASAGFFAEPDGGLRVRIAFPRTEKAELQK